jgi:hypothetical protein
MPFTFHVTIFIGGDYSRDTFLLPHRYSGKLIGLAR